MEELSARHRRAKAVFLAALERPAEERDAYVAAECGGDPELIAEVRAVLAFHADEPTPRVVLPPLEVGERFANRYTILEPIGRGGMGEVYRVRDEVLGESVALKRLIRSHRAMEAAMVREVRLARRITHPAVCRVHDVGDHEGQRFLTMEYVDGEDLATLLSRVGSLPTDRVVHLARELAVGLASAHAQGVVHRDLKPGNILIDRRGRARITDFGVAILKDEGGGGVQHGTPSYMAPEQLVPDGMSDPRSDLYALGLVLHEAATGEPVFSPSDRVRALTVREQGRVPTLSSIVPGIDPSLDRAVAACLAFDPRRRPESALHFVELLPDGDALGAAVEARATPSPGLVADAGAEGWESSGTASGGVKAVGMILGLAGVFVASATAGLIPLGPSARHPAELVESAVGALRSLGYAAGSGVPSYHGFLEDLTEDGGIGPLFWYREEHAPYRSSYQQSVLDPAADLSVYLPATAPPPQVLVAIFNQAGELVYLQGDHAIETSRSGIPLDPLQEVMRLGGVDAQELAPAEARPPPGVMDDVWGWRRDRDGLVERVEAAVHGRRVVYFSRGLPPDLARERTERRVAATSGLVVNLVLVAAFAIVAAASLFTTLRRQSTDWTGTAKTAAIASGLALGQWALLVGQVSHPLSDARGTSAANLAQVPFIGFVVALFYVALEPTVRRRSPRTLVAWARVLRGRLRNEPVARSLSVGVLAGISCGLFYYIDVWTAELWAGGVAGGIDQGPRWLAILGFRPTLAVLFGNGFDAIARALVVVFSYSILTRALPVRWVGAFATVVLVAFLESTVGGHQAVSFLSFGIPVGVVSVWVIAEVGFLAYVIAGFVFYSLKFAPVSLEPAWWGLSGWITVFTVLSIGLAGIALSDRGDQRPAR